MWLDVGSHSKRVPLSGFLTTPSFCEEVKPIQDWQFPPYFDLKPLLAPRTVLSAHEEKQFRTETCK